MTDRKTVSRMRTSKQSKPTSRSPNALRRVIIDSDPGIDDALALILALQSSRLQIEGITLVAGNVALDHCATNIFQILKSVHLEAPPPVARGCSKPLRRALTTASHVHGTDGLGDISSIKESDGTYRYPLPQEKAIESHASDFIANLLRKNPNEITIVALGPLTNIATAIQQDPEAMRQVHEIIVMGGSLNGKGNVTAVAEFNFFVDPDAAQVVISSGLPVTLVSLDVTHKTKIRREQFMAYANRSRLPTATFIIDVSKQYFDFAESCGEQECFLHDPLAIGVAIDRTIVRTEKISAHIEREDPVTSGMLITDRRNNDKGQNVSCATEVDADRFVTSFLNGLFH